MGIPSKFKNLFRLSDEMRQDQTHEKKSSATGHITVQFAQGQPQFTPRHYEPLAKEGYLKNVIAYRCIRLIAQNVAAIPLCVKSQTGQGVDLAVDHPLKTLLAQPNPMQSYAEFIEALCGFLLISGNGYIESVGPDQMPAKELWILRPDRMQIIPGKNGIPKSYRYAVNGQYLDFPVDCVNGESQILHLKNFHPLNDWYGTSPMEAAAYSIDQHNEASKWNTALLQNAGRPSGALIYNPKEGDHSGLTDEQRHQLKSDLESYYQGGQNAGRPLILEGGLDWREMALSPKDMDWRGGKDMAARDIALAFNVPPQLVGVEGSLTYANFEQARLAFYDDAVLPLIDHICQELNGWLVPQFESQFNGNLKIDYDRNAIEALSPRREKIWERINDADFLTVNEKRHALGFSRIDSPEADQLAEML